MPGGEMMKQPTINIVKGIAKDHNAKGVILICFDEISITSASYGVTKEECRPMGRLLENIIDKIEAGELEVWK
jgi:hypothetical protein